MRAMTAAASANNRIPGPKLTPPTAMPTIGARKKIASPPNTPAIAHTSVDKRFTGTLTQHDVQQGTRFDDAVAFGAWPVDMHTSGGVLNAPAPTLDQENLSEGV